MSALAPLSALFGAGVAARNALYDRGILHVRRLKWPVISIGNLSVGGAGKTPFTILLGELLQSRQIPFDILSRGYGRSDTRIRLVDDKGSSADFGDEPLLMARKLGVPVIVGADRFAAGQFAEQEFSNLRPAHGGTWVHLLDDAFQHRQLHRDFDIVIVTPSDAQDSLLPVGRLREPLTSLRRAHAIVLTDGASLDVPQLREANVGINNEHVWCVTRHIETNGAPSHPIAFCGIARPERFFRDLRTAGIEPAGELTFPDHHAYTETDIRNLLSLRLQKTANGFITTEKDAINLERLRADLRAQLQPLTAAALKMELADSEKVLDILLGTLSGNLHSHLTR
ncbi:MAG: lipid-A-disaccharide kinase [Acidobacteriales bacterium]|nr:lipid-A-disaccharide kinase [Terriglobales bacterium]